MGLQEMLHEEAIRWEKIASITSEITLHKDCLQKAKLFRVAEQIVELYFLEH